MNELDFLDLVVLEKIDPESSVEKFGSLINTSFFETANLLGTIKIKGYIDIESSVGGASKVAMTDAGATILSIAKQRSKEPIDPLDNAILQTVASGVKELEALRSSLNIRSSDLAFHIYKLIAQGYMDYEVHAAKVSFVLTETGFNATGGLSIKQKPAPPNNLEKGGWEEAKETAFQSQPESFAPPWVDKKAFEQPAGKQKGKPEKKAEESQEEEAKEKHEGKKRELSPEEQKRLEKRRRLISKFKYYLSQYAPYILLLLAACAIFAGTIYLAGSKA